MLFYEFSKKAARRIFDEIKTYPERDAWRIFDLIVTAEEYRAREAVARLADLLNAHLITPAEALAIAYNKGIKAGRTA